MSRETRALEGETTRRSPWITLGIVLVTGVLIGGGITVALVMTTTPPSRSFTVMAYHWGFAIYDEDGDEVPSIQVEKGTVVTLFVMGAASLSHDLHHEYMERTIEAWEDNPEFGGKNHTELHELMEEAEDTGLTSHGLGIKGYGMTVRTDADSPTPKRVTFVADQTGSFDFYCAVDCGWGHQYMQLEGGLVVS